MRIDEIATLKKYLASVRLGGVSLKTSVEADTQTQARQILSSLFGASSVLSLQEMPSRANESALRPIKPLTPDQQRLKCLSDQAVSLKQQEKRLRAQQGVAKAQERLRKASAPVSSR